MLSVIFTKDLRNQLLVVVIILVKGVFDNNLLMNKIVMCFYFFLRLFISSRICMART